MNDSAQNVLVREDPEESTTNNEPKAVIYDADARNRFEFDVREGIEKYETAHVFEPITDDRYLQWLKEFKLKGTEDDVSEEAREATCRLWDDLIVKVEKIQYPEGADWKSLISTGEKIQAINKFYLAVAIAADVVEKSGDRVLGGNETQTVKTETFFNGDIAVQDHVLRKSTLELEKKYSRIQGKRFKQEQIGGLRRKPKMIYMPQDEKFGELYDEMFVSQTGFANGKIPLRFKTAVIHHLFAENLDEKKSQG